MKKFSNDYGVYCSSSVFKSESAINLVIRDFDGDWQFLSGHESDSDEPHLVGVGHLIKRDKSLAEMVDLKVGQGAQRIHENGDWEYFELE